MMNEPDGYSKEVIFNCLLPEGNNWESGRSEGNFDYEIESFGLTEREVEVLLASGNGIRPPAHGYTPEYLSLAVMAASKVSFGDHKKFGLDLNMLPNDSPETPYNYIDLSEKIGRLHPAAVARIEGYVLGYWAGIRDKTREIEEGA